MIACHKSCLTRDRMNTFRRTVQSAMRVFPASAIFVCDNGPTPHPVDRTQEVCRELSRETYPDGSQEVQYLYVPEVRPRAAPPALPAAPTPATRATVPEGGGGDSTRHTAGARTGQQVARHVLDHRVLDPRAGAQGRVHRLQVRHRAWRRSGASLPPSLPARRRSFRGTVRDRRSWTTTCPSHRTFTFPCKRAPVQSAGGGGAEWGERAFAAASLTHLSRGPG